MRNNRVIRRAHSIIVLFLVMWYLHVSLRMWNSGRKDLRTRFQVRRIICAIYVIWVYLLTELMLLIIFVINIIMQFCYPIWDITKGMFLNAWVSNNILKRERERERGWCNRSILMFVDVSLKLNCIRVSEKT